jgi:hypothetical protein
VSFDDEGFGYFWRGEDNDNRKMCREYICMRSKLK